LGENGYVGRIDALLKEISDNGEILENRSAIGSQNQRINGTHDELLF
jgi:hypothetical protein